MPVASFRLQWQELLQLRVLSAVATKVRNFGVAGNYEGRMGGRDELIVDSLRRLEQHNIMSSTTGATARGKIKSNT